jgi:type IV fimbrial biogenesis protein FimT
MARRNNGFTLLDLMAAVLITGVALGLALPSFAALLERNRALAVFHELGAALAGARMAAVQLGRPVTVCPSQDGLRCRRDLVWEDGWMTYIDADRSDQPRSADAVIRHVQPSGQGIAVRSSIGRHRIRFQPSGWASGANISLRICSRSAQRLLGTVVVNNAGRPRSERREAPAGSCPHAP